jgi:Ca2+:H+ antiporter
MMQITRRLAGRAFGKRRWGPALHWALLLPIACAVLLGARIMGAHGLIYSTLLGAGLLGAVMSAVHHSEVVAHRIGEPYGTLVLALTVTMIEVALIVSLMISGGSAATALARDTVFASTMLILTGLMGLCFLMGGRQHREQSFGQDGVSASLAILATIAALTLVFPNFTTSAPGPAYSSTQLGFVATVSLLLYGTFIFVQTVRHRDYFLPPTGSHGDAAHADPPSNRQTVISAGMLLGCLITVVLAAEVLAPLIESTVIMMNAPKEMEGLILSSVVLMPEGYAAIRAAQRNRLQTSLNLALGSALASIGFTIPAIATYGSHHRVARRGSPDDLLGVRLYGDRSIGSAVAEERSSFAAILTRSASDLAFILRITFPRCAFTVISLSPRSPATCLFSNPLTTNAIT